MGKVTRKIVGTELVFGIAAVALKVFFPRNEKIEVFFRKRGIPLNKGYVCRHYKHISALFNGHLTVEAVVAIDLSVDMGVTSGVVRSKIKDPVRSSGIFEDGTHHALHKLGVVEKEHRYGRVAYVHGCSTTV